MIKLNYGERLEKVKYKAEDLKKIALAFKIEGSGVEKDPLIIADNPGFLSEESEIYVKKSQLFLTIRNCSFKQLKLIKCKNITFEKCDFNYLVLKQCSEITIKDSTFDSISISKSTFINLKDSTITDVSINDSFLNSFESCNFTNIKIFRSPDNTIDGKLLTSEKEGKKLNFPNNFHGVMVSIIAMSYIISSLYFSIRLMSLDFVQILIYIGSFGIGMMTLIMFVYESLIVHHIVKKSYPKKTSVISHFKRVFSGYLVILLVIILSDIFFSIDLFYSQLWINRTFRNSVLLLTIFLGATFIFLSINFLIYSRWLKRERKNPFYPYFLPTVSFVGSFIFLLGCTLSLDILGDLFFPLLPTMFSFLFFLLFTAYFSRYKFKKWKRQGLNDIIVSDITFNLVISVCLFPIYFSCFLFISYITISNIQFAFLLIIFALIPLFLVICLLFNVFSKSSDYIVNAAGVYSSQGKYDKAIVKYKIILDRNPKNMYAWNNLAVTYAKLQYYKEAESAFLKALEIQGDQKAVLASLGTLYVHMEKYDDAIRTLKKALELFHRPSVLRSYKDILRQRWEAIPEESLWQNLAISYSKKKDFPSAMESCYNALKINPKNKESWVTLASVHNEKEEYDKMMEACENALKIDPSFDVAIALLGVAFHKKGDLQKAVEYLKKAVELTPTLSEAWFKLAKVYFDLKQFENAREACNRSIHYKPEWEEAHSLLKKIDNSIKNN